MLLLNEMLSKLNRALMLDIIDQFDDQGINARFNDDIIYFKDEQGDEFMLSSSNGKRFTITFNNRTATFAGDGVFRHHIAQVALEMSKTMIEAEKRQQGLNLDR